MTTAKPLQQWPCHCQCNEDLHITRKLDSTLIVEGGLKPIFASEMEIVRQISLKFSSCLGSKSNGHTPGYLEVLLKLPCASSLQIILDSFVSVGVALSWGRGPWAQIGSIKGLATKRRRYETLKCQV